MVKHIIDYKTLMEAPSLRKFHYYEHSAVLFLNGVENVVVCSNLLQDIVLLKYPTVVLLKYPTEWFWSSLNVTIVIVLRYTVGKITPIQRREVRASDYGPRASFWMNFPKNGSRLTPSHHADDFKWKDYCPMVFRFVAWFPNFHSLRLYLWSL